jgi:AhpD family alkylhydroperoxidase
MLRALLTWMMKQGEKVIGKVDMDYAYHLRDVAPWRLVRFAFIKVVEGPRKITSPEVYHAVGLAAAMVEDCGPCVQIHVNLAMREKVPAELLRNLVARKLDQAPEDVAIAFAYGEKVSRGEPADEERDALRAKWGEKGLIELAFAAAVARFYPGLKRGLGYAHTCERVVIGDEATWAVKADAVKAAA